MNYKRLLVLGFTTALMLGSCSSKKPITRTLFGQSGRAHIYLPTSKEERSAVLNERAVIQTKADTIKREREALPQDAESITLDALVVTADRPLVRISTVRNGYVNLKFLITLPKVFMDERWQVTLRPTLLNGQEQVELPPVVLQGSEFKAKQDKEYESFEAFKAGVVNPNEYDTRFFDIKKHNRFTKSLQREYLKSYTRDFNLQMRYDRWRRIMEERKILFDAQTAGNYDQAINAKGLKMLKQAYEEELYGQDSTIITQKFRDKYISTRRDSILAKLTRPIRERDIPRPYRTLYKYNLTADSIKNKSVTEADSIRIAEFTYKKKEIAQNEGYRNNLDTYEKHMIRLPRISEAHSLQPMRIGEDLAYMYSREIEVKEGLQRRLRIKLDTRVTALDQSTWWQTGLDTLSFIVSGMNDLADKSLAERLEGTAREEYDRGLERLAAYDYKGALDILNNYPDYNSALCLVALGYNAQAIQLLDKLSPSNAKMDYLRAIVYSRDKQFQHARHYLLQSIKQNPQLAYKVDIEPEFAPLLAEYPTLHKEAIALVEGEEELE